jgi:hypothetical protein
LELFSLERRGRLLPGGLFVFGEERTRSLLSEDMSLAIARILI